MTGYNSLLCCWLRTKGVPAPSRITTINVGHARRTRIMIVPWAGVALFNVRTKSFTADQRIRLQQALDVRFNKARICSFLRVQIGRMRINPLEIQQVLLRYKRRECTFATFLDELIIYHGKSIILCHLSLGVVHIIGDSWNVFRSHIFLNGVLAMMVSL